MVNWYMSQFYQHSVVLILIAMLFSGLADGQRRSGAWRYQRTVPGEAAAHQYLPRPAVIPSGGPALPWGHPRGERHRVLRTLERLAYAKSEEEYLRIRGALGEGRVDQHLKDNWDGIRSEWVRGLAGGH